MLNIKPALNLHEKCKLKYYVNPHNVSPRDVSCNSLVIFNEGTIIHTTLIGYMDDSHDYCFTVAYRST